MAKTVTVGVERAVLSELTITNLGLIAQASLEFSPGLSVITGETGAGKTMLLTAIEWLRGGRTDTALLRNGTQRALVTGLVDLPPHHPALELAQDLGASLGDTPDEGGLVLVRSLTSGRSRAVVGGCPVPAAVLAGLTEDLITVHGQSDQLRLTSAAQQRDLLDAYAGPDQADAVAACRQTYTALTALTERLARLTQQSQTDLALIDSLAEGLTQIRTVAPTLGEDEAITTQIKRLTEVEDLRRAAGQAQLHLTGGEGGSTEVSDSIGHINAAIRVLSAASRTDPALAELAGRLPDLQYQLQDLGLELADYLAGLEADPLALEALQDRRSVLKDLTRRYGPTLTDVLAWADTAERRLVELDGGSDAIAQLQAELAALTTQLRDQVAVVSANRRAAVDHLTAAVNDELASLAMPQATFSIRLNPIPPGANGAEEVSFDLTAYLGAPARPLGKGASGGELSRIMLAVEVSLLGAGAGARASSILPTMVFDEVDAGIGGQAALEVGLRLARLSRAGQVIVVTHLPQVAAFADRHITVTRSTDATATTAVVTGPDREIELARMLSGQIDSALARTHAAELLAHAADLAQPVE